MGKEIGPVCMYVCSLCMSAATLALFGDDRVSVLYPQKRCIRSLWHRESAPRRSL